MADGLSFSVTDEEKEDIEVILEGGDFQPNDWERKFLSNMAKKEYINSTQREKLDEVLKNFNLG